jgi:hypothetical protein
MMGIRRLAVIVFRALKQNGGSHRFESDREMEIFVT